MTDCRWPTAILLTSLLAAGCYNDNDNNSQNNSQNISDNAGDLQDTDRLLQEDSRTSHFDYQCSGTGNVQVRHEPQRDELVLFMTGRAIRLGKQTSASGAKYARDDVVFWMKGDEAILQSSELGSISCSRITGGKNGETDQVDS